VDQLDGVVISGGEPTIQKNLIGFIKEIKKLGYNIKLDTNGSNPEMIEQLLEQGLVDYIAMDIKAPLKKYTELTGTSSSMKQLLQSIDLISHNGVAHEFRTTVVKPLLSEHDIKEIRSIIPSTSTHHIQTFNPQNALDPSLRN